MDCRSRISCARMCSSSSPTASCYTLRRTTAFAKSTERPRSGGASMVCRFRGLIPTLAQAAKRITSRASLFRSPIGEAGIKPSASTSSALSTIDAFELRTTRLVTIASFALLAAALAVGSNGEGHKDAPKLKTSELNDSSYQAVESSRPTRDLRSIGLIRFQPHRREEVRNIVPY